MRSSAFSASLTMEHWQFLIQKQGDRSWHTLESPKVEISEGRYRFVARSNLANMDVEVRVIHYSTLEGPTKRRVYKRSRRTNAEGLMAVIPFTYLKPGFWELQCSGDLMSDIFGKPWLRSLKLQVLPQGRDGLMGKFGDGESEYEEISTIAETSTIDDEDATIDQPVSPVWLQGETAEQILQHLVELALPTCENFTEDEVVEDSPLDIPELPLLLSLEQEIYIARWGQTLSIDGCVQSPETSTLQKLVAGELRLELRSPQSLEILAQTRQPLSEKLLPFAINSSIEIPVECESKLILGEMSLHGKLASASETTLLASQSFTITADITQLLAINNPAASEPEPAPKPSVKLDLELFNIVKSQKIAQSSFTQSATNILPPLVTHSYKSTNLRSPQLPKLPQKQTPVAVCKLPKPIESLEKADPVTHLEQKATTDTTAIILACATPKQLQSLPKNISFAIVKHKGRNDSIFPFLRRIKSLPGDRENITSILPEKLKSPLLAEADQPQLITNDKQNPDDSFNDSVAVVVQRSSELLTVEASNMSPLIRKWMHSHGYSLPEPIDVEYEDYDTSLPTHEEISQQQSASPVDTETLESETQLEATEEQETTEEFSLPPSPLIPTPCRSWGPRVPHLPISPSSPLPLPPPPPLLPIRQFNKPAWLAKEIVVDDTDGQEELGSSSQQEEIPAAIASAITEPLPTPQLYVPEGELICGKFVRVRVELDCVRPKIAIKLWVEDCQTRRILDGPCLLTNLLPTTSGLEVTTQIHIPLGCLEVRIEAIAVDTANQQESHKATVVRTVIPEDLPTLQLDELLGI
ncbi:hypothetical protein [Fischerella sp. NIES-3754]|uniref:hypothetical protein n=1 Tax=Fischerella sp. NIES-3754 TaxID=1752063 RepID=UPI0007207CA6|nr:hypothetical protein [Fischerella sp. NIES-3754]BAU06970.1 unknown protein [Fischerella sp. NIES-3754]